MSNLTITTATGVRDTRDTEDTREDGLGRVLNQEFFAHYWRAQPVLLRQAATGFLSCPPSPSEIRTRASAESRGAKVHTDGRTVWFLEGVTDELASVGDLCTRARQFFEWDDLWCDVFLTVGASSVGCHYDDSDNFSVQLTGSKRWRLSSSIHLPLDERRRRALGEPGLGDAELGPDVYEFEVNPGDVLYIPSLWVHHGESDGDSTSVSLVLNTRSGVHLVAEPLLAALRHRRSWWAPFPVGPGSGKARSTHVDALLADVGSGLGAAVQGHARRTGLTTGGGSCRRDRPLEVDLDRVRSYVATSPPSPATGFLFPSADTTAVLQGLLARRTLRQLLRLVVQRVEGTVDGGARAIYQRAVDALLLCSDRELDVVCSQPEVTSWVAVADRDTDAVIPRREDPLADALALALAPEVSCLDGPVFAVRQAPDLDGGFTLRRLGFRVVWSEPRGQAFWLLGGDHGPLLLDRGEIPLPADGTAYVDGDLAIGPLPRLLGVGPTMAPAPTGWAADYIPRTEHLHAASPAEFPVFCASMVEAAELLIDQWPHAWQHLASELRWLLPLPDSGKPAHNYSVHAFRGLVVSSPRAPHALAQTLVHEGAHNRMSTIIDLFELCENAAETVWSPIVEAKRPLTAVFHGCFAFSQDIALTRLLLESPHGHPVASMERYLENRTSAVRSGLEVLRSTARLAPVGKAILDEITGLLGDG